MRGLTIAQGKLVGVTDIIPGRFSPPYPNAPWPANLHLIKAMQVARLAVEVYRIDPAHWSATEDRFHAYWSKHS